MTGKVKCTCGWSWNKSDSSKKDMYVCHECGRDNSNNMKNGGWLDNYGEEDNYNDSQASAPEGMVGDGFSNVGRNYSPAWGGQFQMGGSVYPVNYVPEAQMGGSLPGATGHMYARYEEGGKVPGDVGFSYPRTGEIPSNGPYAKKTMASAQNGKEMQYYQNGLDFKPKSISKNGGWLSKYDVAQDGDILDKFRESHPSIRSIQNDAMNRKIQQSKGRGKETTVTQKDNTRTVTPKVDTTKPLTKEQVEARRLTEELKQNIASDEETALQGRKDQVFESMQEFYKSPLGSPGYFTPEGVAIGALQGAFKMPGDIAEGNYKGAAIDALMALPIGIPAAKGLGRVLGPEEGLMGKVSQEVNINRNLSKIKKEGQLQGLSDYEIAKKQMEEVGITSNQRKGYTPIVSELAEKYVTPYGYTGTNNGTKLSQTINNIKQGGVDINKIDPERLDAWKLYLGRPQVNETFSLADTAPAIHPSYKPGSLEGMDIYNINSKRVLGDIPEYPLGVNRGEFMNILENPIAIDRERRIMGGYNKVMTKEGTQYNDIWDLDPHLNLKDVVPNKISGNTLLENIFYKTNAQGTQSPRGITVPVSKVFGKPFMSHGNLPYSSTHYVDDLKLALQGEIEALRPIEHTAWEGPERIKAWEQQIKNLKNYPKFKDGGIIKDDRGQWDHPGEITEINSNDITMEGVPYDVLGVSDTGDTKLMKPGKNYKFKGKKVTEYPMAQDGIKQELNTVAKDNTSVYNKERKKDKLIVPGTPVVPVTHGNWLNKLITENITPYGYWTGTTHDVAPNKELDDYYYNLEKSKIELNKKYNYDKNAPKQGEKHYGESRSQQDPFKDIEKSKNWKKENKQLREQSQKDLKKIAYNENTGKPIEENIITGQVKNARPATLNASYDALNLNQGIPQKYNSFVYSNYKPSNSKEDSQYYSLAPQYEDEIKQDLFERRNADFINSKDKFRQVRGSHIADASLKDYQYSKGKDEKGDYVAYYDVNDYGNILDVLPNSNPFEIYGRIYYDKKTGKPIPKQKNGGEFTIAQNGLRQEQKGLQNLDNLTNFTNYNKPQPGSWLEKYN